MKNIKLKLKQMQSINLYSQNILTGIIGKDKLLEIEKEYEKEEEKFMLTQTILNEISERERISKIKGIALGKSQGIALGKSQGIILGEKRGEKRGMATRKSDRSKDSGQKDA